MLGVFEELGRSTFALLEEEATVFLAKLGTEDGVLGALAVVLLLASGRAWGFTMERQILLSSGLDLGIFLTDLEPGILREPLR